MIPLISLPIMIRWLMFALIMACTPLPAEANWQFTKWGMTEAQVTAASKQQMSSVPPQSVGLPTLGKGEPRLKMDYHSGNLAFDAYFIFDSSGRLSAIDLRTNATNDVEVTSALRSKYGKPIREEPADNDFTLMEWVSDKDDIRYGRFLDDIDIVYSARRSGNASGL
jgi:hypothetical protein